jgi:hypothetical protein
VQINNLLVLKLWPNQVITINFYALPKSCEVILGPHTACLLPPAPHLYQQGNSSFLQNIISPAQNISSPALLTSSPTLITFSSA